MYLDYSKIIGNNYNLYVTDEKLEALKELARKEKEYVLNKYRDHNIPHMTTLLSNKAIEVAYVNSRNSGLTNAEKSLVANNITFDDNRFAEIINKGNFGLECLEVYMKLITYIKTKIDNNTLTEDDNKYISSIDIYTRKLVVHFTKYVGAIDKHIIINKINEILSFKPELLNTKEKKHTR